MVPTQHTLNTTAAMEDFIQILVYVAFLLIYLVSKVLKNKKEKSATRLPEEEAKQDFSEWDTEEEKPVVARQQGRSAMDEPERKRGTFDEMLRELAGYDELEEERRQEEDRKNAWEEQQRTAREQAEEAKQKVEQEAETYSKTLSGSVGQAKRAKRIQDKNLQEIEQMVKPLKSDRDSRKKTRYSLGKEVAASLRNPKSAKKAIILSEIINRKYF